MKLSKEMRKLAGNWQRGDFPKHLEWLELSGFRGWTGQRIDFKFPIVAIVGENGAGKSTIIQSAASIYDSLSEEKYFASDFFPDTPWDTITNVTIKGSIQEGSTSTEVSVRKPTTRWRGNETRKKRPVRLLDLRRTQPIYAKTGYSKLAKANVTESNAAHFDIKNLDRFSKIVGKSYTSAKQAITNLDRNRQVPVVSNSGFEYSGFHQGAGEATVADLVSMAIQDYSIVLIDEIETSLHPRAQRRLLRDLANISRLQKVQFIITTHSPYILEELPVSARVYVFKDGTEKKVVPGVSPEFALSRMDEESHPEVDIYVEDEEAKIFTEEMLANKSIETLQRCAISAFGAASVGKSLGIMVANNRFIRPTVVILDGDQDESSGCLILPGDEAPERMVFEDLSGIGWEGIAQIVNRSHSDLVNAAEDARTQPDHHDWIKLVADKIIVGGNELWRAMCRVWFARIASADTGEDILELISDHLDANS